MREFSTGIGDALLNGLKPDETVRDTMFFEDLYNLVPSELNLGSYEEIQDILGLPKDWYPFPQWFKLEHDDVVVGKEEIYEVDKTFQPFDLKYRSINDWSGDEFSEPFRVVDYGEDWILVNRSECLYRRGGEVYYTNLIQSAAVVKDNNRTLIGGATNGLWTDRWLSQVKMYASSTPVESIIDSKLPPNFVLWSSFDSHDFPFGLIYPEEIDIKQMLYSNQFGFMEMPFRGDILDMVVSRGQVFVFGEDGICSLAMQGESTGAGYGITGKQEFGIKKRGAVGGNEQSLVFIDKFNQLWKVTGEGLQLMGFDQYMSELSGDIYITRDPDEDLFYIGDQNTSYLLKGQKLTRINQTVQNAVGEYENRAGVAHKTGDSKARIKTQKIDLGIGSNKTLTGATVVIDKPAKGYMKASSDVQNKRVEAPKVNMNPEGYAATRLFGKNHQLEIVFDDYEELNVDNIELKWQVDDKRQTRGTFAPQDSTGAG